jgi:hypothetical protein
MNRVIKYRRRPSRHTLALALFVMAAGAGGAAYFMYGEPRVLPTSPGRAYLCLAAAAVIAGWIVIVATSKLWFKHLWHKRRH